MLSGVFPALVFLLLEKPPDPEMLRIGIVESVAEDKSPRYREIFAPELNKLVKEFTGFRSVALQGLDAFTAAKQLEDEKWHLGVFTAVEFAWVQKKYPNLEPLMLAITEEKALQATLVVRTGSDIKSFADLKGKDVAILESRLPCRLFADKGVPQQPRNTFARFFQYPNGEDALDAVLRGKVKAAIVDTPSLRQFQDLYPGRFKLLTILARSPSFPPPVIVYRRGALSAGVLKKFQNGMLKANQSVKGREALATFHILRFGEVPKDFANTLAKIAKTYPPPE